MDITQSPLTQQARPDVFEPKVVTLYRQLLGHAEEDHDLSDDFWRELFLLRPDLLQFRQILESIDADTLLHIESHTRLLVLNAVDAIKAAESPSVENALETLTVFFTIVLQKRYTNPSSDIIEVLAGLDSVDVVFTDLVSTLEQTIREGRDVNIKQKAVRTAMSVVAGSYQTALMSYFIHKDFFPALTKLIAAHDDPIEASVPFLLVGLLANHDKFESATNSYRTRIGDFVNDTTMSQVSECIGWTSELLRNLYTSLLDDTPASWSIGGTLSYVGLGSLAGVKPAVTVSEEAQKLGFGIQPGPQAAMLLPLYDFILANRYFALHLISYPSSETAPTPFSSLLSFMSYLTHHAYRSQRAGWYAYLSSLILLILVTDPQTSKSLLTVGAPVRLCRQRPPYLPALKPDRPYVAAVLDIALDGINHNLRKKLDTTLYTQLLSTLTQALSVLGKSRTKLAYHWPELWRSLLSFIRFLVAYSDDIKGQLKSEGVATGIVDVLTVAVRLGETFVPNAKDFDDLVYKLLESGDALIQFRDAYTLGNKTGIEQLISVSKHYRALIDEQHGGKVVHLSPREVSKIIKQGYETFTIEAADAVEHATYREADHKSSLKRMLRVVLVDAQTIVNSDGLAVPLIQS